MYNRQPWFESHYGFDEKRYARRYLSDRQKEQEERIQKQVAARKYTRDRCEIAARRLKIKLKEYYYLRNYRIWWLWRKGWSYRRLGRKFALSPTRVRQIEIKMERRRHMRTTAFNEKAVPRIPIDIVERGIGIEWYSRPQDVEAETQCSRVG